MVPLICIGLGVSTLMLAGAISPAGGIFGGLAGGFLCMPRNQTTWILIGVAGLLGLVSNPLAALIGCLAVMFIVKAVAGDKPKKG